SRGLQPAQGAEPRRDPLQGTVRHARTGDPLSQIDGGRGKPALFMAAMGYFVFLGLALIGWHQAPEVVLGLTLAGIGIGIMSLRPYLGLHVLILTLFVENAVGSTEAISPMKI